MRSIDKARLNKAFKLTVFVVILFFLIREYFPYPHEPRIEPGTNAVDLDPGSTTKVFGRDFSVRVLQAHREGMGWWPFARWPALHLPVADWIGARHATKFEVFRPDGTCQVFELSGGETVFLGGPQSVLITFRGTFRNRARLQFEEFPVVESDIGLNLNHSEQIPTTDLVLTVVSIKRPPNLGPGSDASGPAAPTPATVTFSAHRAHPLQGSANARVFPDQQAGAIVRFEDAYDIVVKSIFPSEVRFAVRTIAKNPGYRTGEPCAPAGK